MRMGLMHTTTYLYPESGCEYGKKDVAFVDETSKGVCGGTSQLKKMFLVDGSYSKDQRRCFMKAMKTV